MKNQIVEYLNDTSKLDTSTLFTLEKLVDKYPYFQTIRVLFSKNLQIENSLRFQGELNTTAIYSMNREILYFFMNKPDRQHKIKEKISLNNVALSSPTYNINELENYPTIHNPEKLTLQKKLINEFIQTRPKIKNKKENKIEENINLVENDIKENDNLITEALAKIYVRQKHYEQAKRIYEKLSLKYPDKSIYFANHIKQITESI